jgi:hypothetical protein
LQWTISLRVVSEVRRGKAHARARCTRNWTSAPADFGVDSTSPVNS